MNGIKLDLCTPPDARLDARVVALASGDPISADEFARRELRMADGRSVRCDDLFSVSGFESITPCIHIVGDLSLFDFVGYQSRAGVIRVDGNVGNHFAAELIGGRLLVAGNAGDHVGGPVGASNLGMSGGRVEISGDAGNYCGTRMRRGEIFVDGNLGDFAGAAMIAGTIGVGKAIGPQAGFGMRRGTIAVADLGDATQVRMSDPVAIRSLYPRLVDFGNCIETTPPDARASDCLVPNVAELYGRLGRGLMFSRRGDLAVGGQGEVLTLE